MLRTTSGSEASGPGTSIADGDLVIVYQRHDIMQAITVDSTKTFGCKFGNFKMQSWIGTPFGSKVVSKEGKGWLYLLAPTPELWTQVLRHRTQILYAADISLITAFMELRPGSIVLESGTGSGSLTTALARGVAPGGRVHTFEFHRQRAEEAGAEFAANGLESIVSTVQRDIEALGFPEELHGCADGVFLDLPGPWKAVESAAKCMRPDGVFCAFSPCIEQVQRTCGALSLAGFYNVQTMECLLRMYEVRPQALVTDLAVLSQAGQKGKRKRDDEAAAGSSSEATLKHAAAKPVSEAKGHTGYLTFARRIVEEPDSVPEDPAEDLLPEDE